MPERDIAKNFWKAETLFPLFMFIFTGVLFYDSLQGAPRPMLLPKAVQFILLVFLAIQVSKSLMTRTVGKEKTEEERAAARKENRKMTVTFIGMIMIPLAAHVIGFILTCCLYVLLTILYWGGSKIHHIIIAELLVVGLIYGLFVKILDVSLPFGLLFGG